MFEATPLLNTVSTARAPPPLPISTSPIVVPPKVALRPTLMVPPPDATAPDSTPPKNTFTRPPLLTIVPVAVPPDETIRAPLLPGTPRLVLSTIVPTADTARLDDQQAGIRDRRARGHATAADDLPGR